MAHTTPETDKHDSVTRRSAAKAWLEGVHARRQRSKPIRTLHLVAVRRERSTGRIWQIWRRVVVIS